METSAQNGSAATAAAASSAVKPYDANDLKRALAQVREISMQVDAGRTWSAIRTAADRPASAPAVEIRLQAQDAKLQTIETDVQRVMSIVCNPAPTPTYIGDGLLFLPSALGFPLIGFADDLQISPSLLMHRRWDAPTTQLLERVLKPGDMFLDIGANIGYFTVFGAALVGFNGRVHAVEANPRTFDVLARNVRLNNIGHVCTLHATAFVDRVGERVLNTFTRNQASSTIAALPDRLLDEWHERPTPHTVSASTLDATFADHPIVFSCIKIDVEGSDGLLWAGGERFFREHVDDRTLILQEWNPPALHGARSDLDELMARFRRHGFSVWRRNDELKVTPVRTVNDLDRWCITELILARDPSRVAAVCP
jgi:FkbM family methyltransferase